MTENEVPVYPDREEDAYSHAVQEKLLEANVKKASRRERTLQITYEVAAALMVLVSTAVLAADAYDRSVVFLAYLIFIIQHHQTYPIHLDVLNGFVYNGFFFKNAYAALRRILIATCSADVKKFEHQYEEFEREHNKYWDWREAYALGPKMRAAILLTRSALLLLISVLIIRDLVGQLTPFPLPV